MALKFVHKVFKIKLHDIRLKSLGLWHDALQAFLATFEVDNVSGFYGSSSLAAA